MRERPITVCLAFLFAVLLPLLALSQAAPQNLTLEMNGQQTQLPVKQLNGRNYVEVEALARAANGSVSFQGNAMRLTLPGPGGTIATPSTQQTAPPANPGFSKEFSRAGIEAMAAIREWRSVLTNGVQNGYPIQSLGLSYYETQAQQALRLASVAANTDADRNAYQLGASEFANMKKLSDKYIATAQSLTYIAPDSLSSDPLDQKVIACAHSLAAMASSGQFIDDGSCH